MKKTNKLLLIAPVILAGLLFCLLTSFKTKEVAKRPCEVTCQFSPTTSDLANVSIDNCNSWASATSVTAGTSFTPMLSGTGCTTLNITTFFPSIHPAGTLRIYKNGVLQISHSVAQNQQLGYDDGLSADCDDYFLVTW